MHHTFTHAHIPNSKLMVMAEMSTFGIFRGRNVRAKHPWLKCAWPKCPSTRTNTGRNLPLGKCYPLACADPDSFVRGGSIFLFVFFFYLDQNSSISGPSFAFRRRTDRDDGPIALCFLGNPDQYC